MPGWTAFAFQSFFAKSNVQPLNCPNVAHVDLTRGVRAGCAGRGGAPRVGRAVGSVVAEVPPLRGGVRDRIGLEQTRLLGQAVEPVGRDDRDTLAILVAGDAVRLGGVVQSRVDRLPRTSADDTLDAHVVPVGGHGPVRVHVRVGQRGRVAVDDRPGSGQLEPAGRWRLAAVGPREEGEVRSQELAVELHLDDAHPPRVRTARDVADPEDDVLCVAGRVQRSDGDGLPHVGADERVDTRAVGRVAGDDAVGHLPGPWPVAGERGVGRVVDDGVRVSRCVRVGVGDIRVGVVVDLPVDPDEHVVDARLGDVKRGLVVACQRGHRHGVAGRGHEQDRQAQQDQHAQQGGDEGHALLGGKTVTPHCAASPCRRRRRPRDPCRSSHRRPCGSRPRGWPGWRWVSACR